MRCSEAQTTRRHDRAFFFTYESLLGSVAKKEEEREWQRRDDDDELRIMNGQRKTQNWLEDWSFNGE